MPNSSPLPTVLLIDDHTLFREGVRLMLSSSPQTRATILSVGNLADAMALQQAPDLILLDIGLPKLGGIEGLEVIKQRWPNVVIVMLSAHDRPEMVREALRKGASAFVSKTAQPAYICQEVRHWLQRKEPPSALDHPCDNHGHTVAEKGEGLTLRQFEVLQLLAQGLSNKAIAYKLHLSENTVRNHVVAILRHFNTHTRTETVIVAQRLGLLPAVVL